jgi:F-type H+-transporting ATPase subunit delta
MAEPVTVARPYAEAAFKLASEKSNLSGWSQMLALLAVVARDPQMQARISNPNVSAQQVEALILSITGDKIDGLGRNFIQVLAHNRRLELLPQICDLFEALRREHDGVLKATIVSALPVNDEQTKQLVARLEAKYQRKISAQVEVDPQLIGGVRIMVGDKVIDATVRGRLDAMAAALTH